jgi:hypothetical protein
LESQKCTRVPSGHKWSRQRTVGLVGHWFRIVPDSSHLNPLENFRLVYDWLEDRYFANLAIQPLFV